MRAYSRGNGCVDRRTDKVHSRDEGPQGDWGGVRQE